LGVGGKKRRGGAIGDQTDYAAIADEKAGDYAAEVGGGPGESTKCEKRNPKQIGIENVRMNETGTRRFRF
jgi:hypothetical protein